MQLVERHIIKRSHSFYKEIDEACFLSKNLYNQANYIIRQEYIKEKKYLNYNVIQKAMQKEESYKALPAKVSQQVLKLLDKNWVSYFRSIKDYKNNPKKYKGQPKLPKYKEKKEGRNVLVYTIQAISKRELSKGIVKPSGLNIKIESKKENIQQLRIIPRKREYIVEVVYNKEILELNIDKNNFISIDIGLDNLATITSNKEDLKTSIINGRVLKSINQYYNKKKSVLQTFVGEKGKSNRLNKLTNKRNKKIDDYLHKSSRYVVNLCLINNIGKIIIGKNKEWKQDINIGKINNQKFVSVPHSKFIEMIKYKSELLGIEVILIEESYTSKCSFIDNEEIKKQDNYLGKRVERGLFKTFKGIKINADVNGSLNIAKKAIPTFNIKNINYGIEGLVVNPIRVNPYKLNVA